MSKAGYADLDAATRHEINVAWPQSEANALRATFREARTTYRNLGASAEAPIRRLTASAFFAAAYTHARAESAFWLSAVRPARWGVSSGDAYTQVVLSWPRGLVETAQEDFERLDTDSRVLWGTRFRLTKAHMLLAGIQFGVRSLHEWLPEVPNDPRCGPRASRASNNSQE